ncbi:alpha/beta hydrolase [Actinomadura algeriensis]|uniref:Esterase n=1 Tax=Actinomadura algeriensis TaxID=1679523 RepID=A0ABR9JKW9_9ACTN|nr:esterase [Actinomadura algeriensis]MBE1531206.1 putative esterase [Actinomadura algeriensis]
MTGPSRREFLVGGGLLAAAGGAAAALVHAGALPGRERAARALGLCGEMPTPPAVATGPVREHSLRTGGEPVRTVIGWPPGAKPGEPLPVTVLLHGGGGDARTPFDVYAIQNYLADAVAEGTPPFAVASVDRWFEGRVVMDVLLPFLAERGLRTGRVGLLGWSMGGAGALRLAAEHRGAPVAVVVATSPAIDDASARRFARELTGIPVWAGCGGHDSFAGPTEELIVSLRDAGGQVEGGIHPGCHDAVFRRKMLPRQLAFLGPRLK